MDVDKHIRDVDLHLLPGGLCCRKDVVDYNFVLGAEIARANLREVDDAGQRLVFKFAGVDLVWVIGDLDGNVGWVYLCTDPSDSYLSGR